MEKTKPERAPQRGDKYILRLPEGLRERVAKSAEDGGRSMNAEFVRRIEQSFEQRSSTDDADRQVEINAVLRGLRDTIAEIARKDNEREDAVLAIGRDLHALCARALPSIADDERYRSLVRMLADVGVSMQAGDITDAQARVRALFYLASDARDKDKT